MRSIIYFLLCLSSFTSLELFAQNYQLEQFSATTYEKSLTRVGKVAFKRTLKLAFKSNGYLKKLSVDEGDYFAKDDLLASLDTAELKAIKNSRYAQLLQAKREVNRVKQLIEKKLSTRQALDLAETNVETSRAAYRVAYYNLEKSELVAPFSGVVLARYADLGEFQSMGQQVVEVAAVDDNLIVKMALTDSEISFVSMGQQVQVRLASAGSVTGVISKIPVTVNHNSQLYLVEVLLDQTKVGKGIFSGQLAQVDLQLSTQALIYRVPVSALIEMNSQGSAILLVSKSDGGLTKQPFDIINIDSQFLYLSADVAQEDISIVVNGWQQFQFSE